jgi:hypothetical protein
MFRRIGFIVAGVVVILGVVILYLWLTSEKSGGSGRPVSGSTFTAVMPARLSGKDVKTLTGVVMTDQVLAEIRAKLPGPSQKAIPDVKTIKRHLSLQPRKVKNYWVVDIRWAYNPPRRGRFATPEAALQDAISDRLEALAGSKSK